MTTTTTTKKAARRQKANTTTKPVRPALRELRLRVNLVKRGTFADDFDKMRGEWSVETDFHATGQITNGPEATVAMIEPDNTASGIDNGFDYRLGHDGAKLLAQIFAGAPRLLAAAQRANLATGKEPKFKHAETYAALTELMAAVEAIEDGSLLPAAWVNRSAK